MPDLSQTQKIYSQTSPSSSHVVELHLDSLDSVQVFLSFMATDWIILYLFYLEDF